MSADDPTCLQCGQLKSRVRAESLFCCTVSGYEVVEVDQEWERHRWADWTDRELDRVGIGPSAYEKHRRTDFTTLAWVDCEDTKRGHVPADAESVDAMWVDEIGQCMACGKKDANAPYSPAYQCTRADCTEPANQGHLCAACERRAGR